MSSHLEAQFERLLRIEATFDGVLPDPDWRQLAELSAGWFVLWDGLVRAGGGSGVVRAVVAGIRDSRATRRLASFVAHRRHDLLLREAAVIAIARTGSAEAEDLLLGWLDPPSPLRWTVAWELARLGSPWGRVALAAGLTEHDLSSVPAATALARTGDIQAVRLLRSLLDDTADPAAGRALGQLAVPSAVPGLLALLHSNDPAAREVAVVALGEIADPRGMPAVIGLLDDVEEPLRQLALAVLAKVTGQQPDDPSQYLAPEAFVPQARAWWRAARQGLVRRACYYRGEPRHLGHWLDELETTWRTSLRPELVDVQAARLAVASGWASDFDAYCPDLEANGAALQAWRQWWRQNLARFPAGVWYWQGAAIEEPARWP